MSVISVMGDGLRSIVESAPCCDDTLDANIDQLHAVCHDLRQPIATILALSAAALAAPDLPASTRHRLQQIVAQGEWLADIVRNGLPPVELLPHPPYESGGSFDLGRLTHDAALTESITYPGELQLRLPERPLIVSGDWVRLRRAVANLLSNATKAAGPAGHVAVVLKREDDWALLLISDDGPGFGRIADGHGLGLQVVAQSLSSCGGRVDYASGALGGTQVRLSVPVITERIREQERVPKMANASGSL